MHIKMPELARKLARALSGLLAIGGFAVLVSVNASDLYAQWLAEEHITQFSAIYDDAKNPVRLEYKRQAILYNERLSGTPTEEDPIPYESQLFYEREPMMSWIEIPRIHVKLPIYHGTGEAELMAGVGHLKGTSLPIGGKSVHCVLLGHSGMHNMRMFDDLQRLEKGDAILIHTLNEPYAYTVVWSEVVAPKVAETKCAITPGRDDVTLITCTPYGVNSHRLLVHATRCPYEPDETGQVGIDSYVNGRNAPLLVACAALALSFGVYLARRIARNRNCSGCMKDRKPR